jgi:hypothetical protein
MISLSKAPRADPSGRVIKARDLGHGCLSVCLECCVLSGRHLCDGPITRPEEFYRV